VDVVWEDPCCPVCCARQGTNLDRILGRRRCRRRVLLLFAAEPCRSLGFVDAVETLGCTSIPFVSADVTANGWSLRTYLLRCCTTELSLRVGVVHACTSEHLRVRLAVTLIRILLSISTHMGAVHLRWSTIWLIGRCHAWVLHRAVVWRSHRLLRLLLGYLLCSSLAACGWSLLSSTAMSAALLSRHDIDQKVEHV